jgi:hypothetical protein
MMEANNFQSHRMGVTLQFKENVAPFLSGVHCFVHKTNLAAITLFNLELVHQLEALYAIFLHNPKKFLEFQKLIDLIQKQ